MCEILLRLPRTMPLILLVCNSLSLVCFCSSCSFLFFLYHLAFDPFDSTLFGSSNSTDNMADYPTGETRKGRSYNR